ncbi:MAG: hypothetical protein EPN25_02560 [Nitrospirae bacterium]|nr:MAG: hypothetical protein EPN25_02560 [Nitrospirota bacterium]
MGSVRKKRIAVLVRDRQAEALRMAVGLTLADDEVSVFVMDRDLEENETNALNQEMLADLGVTIWSNKPDIALKYMATEEIAVSLAGFDTVIPY